MCFSYESVAKTPTTTTMLLTFTVLIFLFTNIGESNLILYNLSLSQILVFLAFFQNISMCSPSITATYNYLGIRINLPNRLGRGGVCVLPVDGNLHSLFLGSLESYAGGISLGRFRGAGTETALYNIITTILTEVVIVEQCTIQIIPDAKGGILAVPAPGLLRTISCGHGSLP